MASTTLKERILKNIIIDGNDCWLWQGYIAPNGYGNISHKHNNKMTHRMSYEIFVDELKPGMHIDHLCKVRHCINPKHLEQVTPKENVHRSNAKYKQQMARTHCPAGHEYIKENIFYGKTKHGGLSRSCKKCNYIRNRLRYLNKKVLV